MYYHFFFFMCRVEYQLPNLIVGAITKESLYNAFENGISAEQASHIPWSDYSIFFMFGSHYFVFIHTGFHSSKLLHRFRYVYVHGKGCCRFAKSSFMLELEYLKMSITLWPCRVEGFGFSFWYALALFFFAWSFYFNKNGVL